MLKVCAEKFHIEPLYKTSHTKTGDTATHAKGVEIESVLIASLSVLNPTLRHVVDEHLSVTYDTEHQSGLVITVSTS